MGNRKKFSQFELPTVPINQLYLVGYEEGTGLKGDNTSIRIKASELAFNISGAAGVSGINGLEGSITLSVAEGLTLDTTGNTITIKGTVPVTVDTSFNATSTNPQSGIAIATALNDYAITTGSNSFTGTQTFTDISTDELTTNKKFRNNGSTILNGSVTIQGSDLVNFMVTTNDHKTDYSCHLTEQDRTNLNSALEHTSNAEIHLTTQEKNNYATKEELAQKVDLSQFQTTETVTEWDNKEDWEINKATVKYFELVKENTVYGTITDIGLSSSS